MNDIISRADAIKDAESWVAVDEYEKHLQKNVVEWLKEFPPAELSTNLAEVGTDCISRQDAIFALGTITMYKGSIPFDTAMMKIKHLPPIQPKRGRWEIGKDERFVQCSECGLMTTRNELRGIAVFGKNEPNFCPNCGAKMEVTT